MRWSDCSPPPGGAQLVPAHFPLGCDCLVATANEKFLEVLFDKGAVVVYMHSMANKRDFSSLQDCLCFNLRRTTRRVTQFFDTELRRHGVRPTQTPILGALAARSGWSMEELSEWLGMERTTLVRNLRPLQRDGLVHLAGAGRGGRVSPSITSKGRKSLAQALPAWQAAQRAVVKTLGAPRWSGILSDLEHATRALNK